MCKLDELRAKREEIYRIARAHKVEKLYVFGSCARKEETPESDVDLLVEFGEGATLFDQMDMREEMTSYLKQPVDVVSKRGLHWYIKNDILKDAVPL